MAATDAQVAQVRRMVNEPTQETYTDESIARYIESYPVLDSEGYDASDIDWTATYDLHAAAADIWEEKAASLAGNFDFSADGGSYSRSQAYEMYMRRASWHRSRRRSRNVTMHKSPREQNDEDWIANN